MEVDLPWCDTCNHRHQQGVKCSLCGHIGRSQLYQKMRVKAAVKRSHKVDYYPGHSIKAGEWDIVMEIRKVVFCEELGIPHDQEFNSELEPSSIHQVAMIGDMPVSTARYRISTSSDGLNYATIDRFAVLPEYRMKGIAKMCMQQIIQEIQSSSGNTVPIILVSVPAGSWIQSKLMAQGMEVVESVPVETRGSYTFVTLLQRLVSTTP